MHVSSCAEVQQTLLEDGGVGVLRGGLRRARGATDVAQFEAPGIAWRRLRAT